jgi:hypothetical protein
MIARNGWVNEWIDYEFMNGLDRWINGWMNELLNGWIHRVVSIAQ